jgi:hypothetical protein
MIYKYEGSGEIKILGSAKQWKKLYYYHKYDSFAVAHYKNKDVAYVKSKSIMGILEKVVIEKVYIKNTTKTFYKNVNFYEDKLKSLYREDELITLQEAQEIINVGILKFEPIIEKEKPNSVTKNISSKFNSGNILYSGLAAKKGELEKVVIKKCVKYKIYLDMLNSMWNESELVDLENAKKIIEENRERKERPFYEKQTVKIQTNEPNNSVPLGSLWCSKSHAQKGEILKILVKRILNDNIIEDKLGSLYQNNDLITVQEGKSIALAYWQNRREDIVDIINKSNADNQ